MPVILTQRFIGAEGKPRYNDVEGTIYHYPRVYFKRIVPDDRFIYYRPAKGTETADAGTYFGHGRLGMPYADPFDDSLRYVDIKAFERFPILVHLRQADGTWVETGASSALQFQSAVRDISLYDYHRILIAGGISLQEFEMRPTTDSLLGGFVSPIITAPTDTFRTAATIPQGTGYAWRGGALPNLAESAALQERARADHQEILRTISNVVNKRGGSWWFNNNID